MTTTPDPAPPASPPVSDDAARRQREQSQDALDNVREGYGGPPAADQASMGDEPPKQGFDTPRQ